MEGSLLAHLRQLMREQQVPLHAYIIPTDDAHQVSIVMW